MQNVLLSVIVPVYNVAQYLEECIRSIIGQTYQNLEVILVDDGSLDESGAICDKYAVKDTRIKVIHKDNAGLVSARKAGCAVATGDYIAFVDGDDKVSLNMYENMVQWAEKEDADIVICDLYEWKEGKESIIHQSMEEGVFEGEALREKLQKHMICFGEYFSFGLLPTACNKLLRRELYIPIQMKVPDSIRLGEDAACTYPSLMEAKKVVYRKEPYYYYRTRSTSMTRTWNPGQAARILTLLDWLTECAKKYHDEAFDRQLLLYACYLLDDYVTGNIKRKIPRGKVKEEYRQLHEHVIVRQLMEYIGQHRTSSRSKRIIKFLNQLNMRTYLELKLFVKWEMRKNSSICQKCQ